MSASDFKAWLAHLGRGGRPISDKTAAKMLGISRNTVAKYRTGEWPVKRQTALACAALAFGLPAFSVPEWRRAA